MNPPKPSHATKRASSHVGAARKTATTSEQPAGLESAYARLSAAKAEFLAASSAAQIASAGVMEVLVAMMNDDIGIHNSPKPEDAGLLYFYQPNDSLARETLAAKLLAAFEKHGVTFERRDIPTPARVVIDPGQTDFLSKLENAAVELKMDEASKDPSFKESTRKVLERRVRTGVHEQLNAGNGASMPRP